MDEKERSQFVDELLEASLSRYCSVAPRPGLEGRVLANARAAHERRAWFVWAGWLAAGAAAVMIAVGVLKFARRQSVPTPTKSAGAITSAKVPDLGSGVTIVPKKQSLTLLRASKRRAWQTNSVLAREENRLPVFPSPSPMTEQEKLLAQYVRTTPAEVLLATSTDSALIPDMEIKPLEIAPLNIDETEPKINQ